MTSDDPEMDRCVCGGVRHWHAKAPYGCDDCSCRRFASFLSGLSRAVAR